MKQSRARPTIRLADELVEQVHVKMTARLSSGIKPLTFNGAITEAVTMWLTAIPQEAAFVPLKPVVGTVKEQLGAALSDALSGDHSKFDWPKFYGSLSETEPAEAERAFKTATATIKLPSGFTKRSQAEQIKWFQENA